MRLSLHSGSHYMTSQMDVCHSWLLSSLSNADLKICMHVGHLGSAPVRPLAFAGGAVTLFLTLVPLLVYLPSGMWGYVSSNLSESTCPVTWTTGQRTHTSTMTYNQLNDMTSAVSHTQFIQTVALMKKRNLVYTRLIFMTRTAHTQVLRFYTQRTDLRAFTTNNQAFKVTQPR